MSDSSLIDRVLAGDVRAVARAISLVEDDDPGAAHLLGLVHAHTGHALLVGVTGPPGAGKSTLVDRLITEYRKTGARVAVLAVDPSSPYTGGAILGDRVRMSSHASDSGVFIRSMATRGHLGGLAHATTEAATLLDAAGFDIVLIETVGVGQDEVDIVRVADICIVVAVPGAGDDVQALKAGLMEIADIFVVNKADRDGAEEAAAAIEATLSLDDRPDARRPPVLLVVATTGAGVLDVISAVARHLRVAADDVSVRRRTRVEWRLREVVARRVMRHLEADVVSPEEWDRTLDQISARELDAHTVAEAWTRRLRQGAIGRLDHIGIATDDEAASVAFFQDELGLAIGPVEEVVSQRVRVRFVTTGDAKLELIEPTSDDSPVAKFLRSRGAGLHHVAIRVSDLEATLATLAARGVRLIDPTPRPGAHGTRVAFVHPASARGVLVELVERIETVRVDR